MKHFGFVNICIAPFAVDWQSIHILVRGIEDAVDVTSEFPRGSNDAPWLVFYYNKIR